MILKIEFKNLVRARNRTRVVSLTWLLPRTSLMEPGGGMVELCKVEFSKPPEC